jgi:NAD(P)-dependent dehydrogenase (short-subunit alcohol dehydrogenase family)
VTGASRGIGAGIAERLAAEGADVVITARTFDKHDHLAGSLQQPAHRLAAYGVKVPILVADLTDETDRARIVPEAAEALGGPIEILVNNAATIPVYGASKAALNRLTWGLDAELYGTGIRVNTVEPRAAVLSEGAAELVGGTLTPDQIESMEEMVEGVVALCNCPADVTGQITVSLDLIRDWNLQVHRLDGSAGPRI